MTTLIQAERTTRAYANNVGMGSISQMPSALMTYRAMLIVLTALLAVTVQKVAVIRAMVVPASLTGHAIPALQDVGVLGGKLVVKVALAVNINLHLNPPLVYRV